MALSLFKRAYLIISSTSRSAVFLIPPGLLFTSMYTRGWGSVLLEQILSLEL